VPTITLHGQDNGVHSVESSEPYDRYFTGRYERRVLEGVGHNLPLEAPRVFADAVLALL
jgi:pimeloyl-ACP methyl ester carboxylesterase